MRDDTDHYCQSTGGNWPPSHWDMAKLLDFLQTALGIGDGNRTDLPVSLSPDALQHQRTTESDRRLKHHSAVQSPLL